MIIPRIPVKRAGGTGSPESERGSYCIPNPYGMQHAHLSNTAAVNRQSPDLAVGYSNMLRRESPLKIKNSGLERFYRPEFIQAQSSSLKTCDIDGSQPRDNKYKDRGKKKSGFILQEPFNGNGSSG